MFFIYSLCQFRKYKIHDDVNIENTECKQMKKIEMVLFYCIITQYYTIGIIFIQICRQLYVHIIQ